ncbi:MAG TPA: D-alanyl-D-alanine carboxypeptidase family protein, partial [Chloroflexota bacterium]
VQLRAIRQAAMPALTARAAIVEDFATGQVLYGKAIHSRLPPASTTKVMTALLTLEQGQLQADVPISPLAASLPCTCMGIDAGHHYTVRELLYGLLLPSGNDAAVALAQFDGPSLPGFVDRMNARAKELGLADTHFVNPHGLDDPAHLSSAADLARLARSALQSQPLLNQYVATASYTLPATPTHPRLELKNLNQLLGSYPGADGVKTGTTEAAGQVLIGSATRNGHRLLMVVMGSADRYAEGRRLLDLGFASIVWFRPDLFFPGAMPVKIPDAAEPIVPAWEVSQVTAYLDPDGMTGTFTLGSHELLKVPLQGVA